MKEQPDNTQEKYRPSTGRKLAEWISLGLSAVIILTLAGFLIYQGIRGHSPLVPVQVEPLLSGLAQVEAHFVLPVRVSNRGRQTLHELTLKLETQTRSGKEHAVEMQVPYVGAGSERIVYFYLEETPAAESVHVRPIGYQLD